MSNASATDLLRLARTRLGQEYLLGALAPKANPDWNGPWDCAEFTSWCVYQLTGELFGCRPLNGNPDRADAYSGFWVDDARRLRCEITVGQAAATKGAFLVRKPGSAIGHVAISDGRGGTVEAHSKKRGVMEGEVAGRRWDLGVMLPWIDATLPATPMPVQPAGIVLRVKKNPMRGELVARVQQALIDHGLDPGPVDGIYGGQTSAAVRAFQIVRGLQVDGEVGRRTAKALGIQWY